MKQNSNKMENQENEPEKGLTFEEKIKEAQEDFEFALANFEDIKESAASPIQMSDVENLKGNILETLTTKFRELQVIVIKIEEAQVDARKKSNEARNSAEWRGFYRGQQVLAADLLRVLRPLVNEPAEKED